MASDAKALTAAQPAATGLHAVRLARNGMRGAREILEHRQGFASQFAFIPVDAMLGGLGRAWVSDSLSCKLYPGCAYIDGPVDAALAARGDRPLRPDEIDSIQITATALTGGMEALAEAAAPPTSLDPITVNFSAKRSVAIALLAGRLTPRELASDWRENNAAAIRALAGRTRLRVSANQTLSMLDGIGRAVPWSGLAREIGARRSWRARHRLRAAMRLGTRDRGSRGRAAEGPRISPRDALGAVGPLIRSLASGPRHLDMDEVDFQKLEFRFGAAVEIRLKGGGVLTGRQPIPLGAAGRPAKETDDLMIRKLHAECGAVGAGESAARIDELLRASAANTPARDVARAAVSSPAAV